MAQRQDNSGVKSSATITEVARLANVSETTVSLAFQDNSRISLKTRQKVREIATRLHYVPNQHAKSLRAGRTKLIGLLVNDLVNPFYAQLAETIEDFVEERGYQLLVFNSRWIAKREIAAIKRMVSLRIEGALVCYSEKTDESKRILLDNDIPHIALDTSPVHMDEAFVFFDLKLAGSLAAMHFESIGCRRPALMMPMEDDQHRFSAFLHLEKGFVEEWQRRGKMADMVYRIPAALTIPSGREAFLKLYRSMSNVDSVFCGNDLCALGAMDAADQLGLKIGEDIAIMGIDNLPVGAIARLGLTTLHEPVDKLANQAASALLEGIENHKRISICHLIEPELILRASTLRFQRVHP